MPKQPTNKLFMTLRRAIAMPAFSAILFVAACLITSFRIETAGVLFFAAVICVILVVCDDILETTLPFMLLTTLLIKCFNSFDVYIHYLWLAPFAVFAVAYHLIVYGKRKQPLGLTFWGLVAVSVSVTLGGVGIISAKDYFSLMSVYYTLGLGIGMLFAYLYINACFHNDSDNSFGERFARIMTIVGLFACFMVLEYYLTKLDTVITTKNVLAFQWRNNVTTFLMLSMPFPFYLSKKHGVFLAASILNYACVLLAGSRSGMIFGSAEFAMLIFLLVWQDLAHRRRNGIVFGILIAVALCSSKYLIEFCYNTFERIMESGNDPRAGLFRRAIEDFLANPIFGRGLAYGGNYDIHPAKKFALVWYHSYPFQVIGSFGIVGIFAFGFQAVMRVITIIRKLDFFNVTVFMSFVGMAMMSLVNPGEFCPLPYELMVVFEFIIIEKTVRSGYIFDSVSKEKNGTNQETCA